MRQHFTDDVDSSLLPNKSDKCSKELWSQDSTLSPVRYVVTKIVREVLTHNRD